MVVLHQTGFARQFDAGADPVAIAFDPDRLDQNPVVAAGRSVVKQFGGTANRRYHHIDLAVIVEIAKGAAAM